ncbi:MAG: amidohydrolase family protein [Chloroflexi bacterium]|nr:amidohydrolase family protein [Chloroflexota bacterium]
MSRTLVKSNILITMSTRYGNMEKGAVIVKDDRIEAVGSCEELSCQGPFDRVLGDTERFIAMPGLINSHHHPTKHFCNGLLDGPVDTWLIHLRERILPGLSEEESYYHALWCCMELIRSGTTALVDMTAGNPTLPEMGAGPILRAYLDSGLRVSQCTFPREFSGYVYPAFQAQWVQSLPAELAERINAPLNLLPFSMEEYVKQWSALFSRYHGARDRIQIFVGPTAPEWCSDSLLKKMKDLARDRKTGIQLHLSESKYNAMCRPKTSGKTAVEHLQDLGFLGEEVSCAHCVWLKKKDWQIMADSGTIAVHNPSSNLRLGDGIAPIADMLKAGMNIAFGVDASGFNEDNDIISDLRLGLFLQRRPAIDAPWLSSKQMLEIAIKGGARAVRMDGGSLEPGKKADIVLIDKDRIYNSPYLHPANSVEDNLLHRATGQDVHTVIVNGQPVMVNRQILTFNEKEVREKVAASAGRYLESTVRNEEFLRSIESHAIKLYKRLDAEAKDFFPPNYQYNTQ